LGAFLRSFIDSGYNIHELVFVLLDESIKLIASYITSQARLIQQKWNQHKEVCGGEYNYESSTKIIE